MIPEYDVAVIDEAHELVSRVTQAATDELSAPEIDRAARRAQRHIEGTEADDLADAGEVLRDAIDDCRPGRIDGIPQELADALALVRDAARALVSAFPRDTGDDAGAHPGQGLGPGAVHHRRADGRRLRQGRALDQRARAQPRRQPALRRAARGRRADARAAARREDRGVHLGHPQARRRLRRRGHLARARGAPTGARSGRASTSARPSTTASRRSSTSPATCPPPAATGSPRPTSTRSPSWSTPPTAAPSGCSPAAGPPRPPPSTSARRCPT